MATTCGVIRWWSARRSSRRSWPRRAWHRFNEHLEFDDGEAVFNHACKMGLEKRLGSRDRSGRSADCLKMKNPACEAVRREAE
jgi:hypothetical protein